MIRRPTWFMDPLEYNILVKLHTAGIDHCRDSIERNIRWNQRCTESYTSEVIDAPLPVALPPPAESSSQNGVTTTTTTTTTTEYREPTPPPLPRIVYRYPICCWRDIWQYPRFERRLYDIHVTEGHNGRLEVRISGVPKPDVRWYKDWQPLASNAKYTIEHFDPDVSVLSIYGADHLDQGLFSCRISNEAGSVHTSAFVHVERDPTRASFYDNIYEIKQ